jgi:hypothetical protein
MHIPVGVGSVGHFMNHGARDVHPDMNPSVVSASTPATSSSRLLTGLCGVVGAILFGSYACTCPNPAETEMQCLLACLIALQSSSFGSCALPAGVKRRLVPPARRATLLCLSCTAPKRSRPSFPQRVSIILTRLRCWLPLPHLTPLPAVGSLKSKASPFPPG